jgi:hypothetical protein
VRTAALLSLVLVACGAPKPATPTCTPADCDDQDVCTTDACSNGECVHTAVPILLTPQGVCSVDTCDPVLGLVHTPVSANDSNACTVDSCDPDAGVLHTAVVSDDGNACTVDGCAPDAGVSHSPVPVDDGNPLTIDSCDPSTGVISHRCSDTVTVVQPGNPGADAGAYPAPGWWSDDTRANGTVTIDASLGAPTGFGCTSAKLVTGASTTPGPSADKAQLLSFALAGTPLSSITTISYWALRSSTSTGGPAIDLSLNVSITGASVPTGYATLVFEPYNQSGGVNGIMLDVWQWWNATATTPGDGRWWTSKIPNGAPPGNPGSQSNPQPWAAFQALYPDALVHGYGFDVGSVNPNMVVAGDGLVFGAVTTDF